MAKEMTLEQLEFYLSFILPEGMLDWFEIVRMEEEPKTEFRKEEDCKAKRSGKVTLLYNGELHTIHVHA